MVKQRERAEAAELDAAQHQAVFDMQQKRMGAATVLWREATGKHDVLPDLGDLLDWLMSEAARQRERADRAENDKTICETANRNLVKSRIAWRERVDALEKAAALLALPYEGLLADSDSRRWIAPALWAAIETGVMAFRALLSPAPSAEPSTEAKEKSRE